MLKALIFDLDGTLVASNKIHLKEFRQVFKESFKISLKDSEILPLFGESVREIAARLLSKHKVEFSKKQLENFVKAKIESYAKAIGKKRLMPKANIAFLKKLKKQGVKLAIASGTERKMLKASLKPEEKKLFSVLVCANDVRHAKPHPELLNLAVKRLKVKKQECIYIGDGLLDAKAAKNSSLKFVGFLSGIASRKEFENSGAVAVVGKIQELSRVLRES
jgi:HAD superfamily hydrolase (TIGR01662 family)